MINLHNIIDNGSTKIGRFVDYCIQLVILGSIIVFSIETLPTLSPITYAILYRIEVCVVVFFTCEYIARLIVAPKKLSYVFSFFGMIDLISILPFYLHFGFDTTSIRAFRLLRLIRIFKLTRYNSAADRFHRAFMLAREEIVLLVLTMLIILYLSGVGIYYFERSAQPQVFASIFDGLWWAVSTLTTVGYGDVYPVTSGGKFFTFLVLLLGLGVIAIPAGLFASALSKAR
jgi:voltage-gated potassium channel